ncbi:unnamed protein product [Blepharisma stoltei]|uniref:Histidine phosphatase family protein n=1 Tax=Blepharisma stoltei TaxID=1481888 RepID=A0AAU9I5Y9_9CILI|nr:unnamed protein product [Blepharisma stoltei]
MDYQGKTIFILQHGQLAESVHPRFRPEYPIRGDPALTELGILQSDRSSQLLSHLIPAGKSVKIITSPYLACIQTAIPLSSQFNKPLIIDWGFGDFLNPIHFSSAPTELTYATEWFSSKFNVQYTESLTPKPTFPETYEVMESRTNSSFINHINSLEEDVIIIVTHFFGLEAITGFMKNTTFRIVHEGHCAITISELKDGKYTVRVAADYSHAPQYIKNN